MHSKFLSAWCRRYKTALDKYVERGVDSTLHPSIGLGRQALSLGLGVLDIARHHQAAFLASHRVSREPGKAFSNRQSRLARAGTFLAKTLAGLRHCTGLIDRPPLPMLALQARRLCWPSISDY